MKKLISLVLALTMLASMAVVNVSAADWSLPEGAAAEPTIRFGLLADSHITTANLSYTSGIMQKAATAFNNMGVDALVLAGDIVMHQNTDTTVDKMIPPYTHLKNALAAANVSTVANTTDVEAGKIPLIYATGNHEFPIGATDTTICKTALDVFGEQMGCEQNSHSVINGIHFITSGGKDYSSDAKHQEAWIKAEIENAKTANTNNPIFLVLHHPTGDTNRYSADFLAYLNQNPNVIVLSAHTHLAVQNSTGIWQGGYTTVTSGYMCGGNQSYSHGLLVEVTGSVVKFFKMDLNEGAYIDEPWVVDITDLSDYTEAGRANGKTPYFASGEKVLVSNITSETATLTWNDAAVEATAPYQDKYIDSYNVKVTDEDGNVAVNQNVANDYYNYNEDTVSFVNIEGLEGGTNYTVSVTAKSLLDKVSEPITAEFTTIDPALEPAVHQKLECEDGVNITGYAGGDITANATQNDVNASGGVYLRIAGGGSIYKWNFKPLVSGFYTFEFVGNGDKEQSVTFEVNDALVYNGRVNTTGSWGVANPEKTQVYKGYMSAGINYVLELVPDKTLALDYFNIYFEKIIEAENAKTKADLTDAYSEDGTFVDGTMTDGASQGMAVKVAKGSNVRLPLTVEKAGLYSISVKGTGDASLTARIDENIAGGRVVKAAKAVKLNNNGITEDVAVFYMDKGTKTLTLTADNSCVLDYITFKQLSNIETKGKVIEAEKYVTSNTPAYTVLYGDYTNGIYASGIAGDAINATYELILTSDTNYRFDMIGEAFEDATVALSFNGEEPVTATVKAGDTKAYIGTVSLTKGTYTVTLTTNGNVAVNAITYEKGEGITDILLNAETDFDKEAGHDKGWHDTTPQGYDDQWMDTNAYSFVDVSPRGNRVGGGVAYMLSTEWFNYKVNIDYSGYYRILLGIHSAVVGGNAAAFTVTINDKPNNAITKSIYRSDAFGNSQSTVPYDDFGLVWLNEGENTIKVKFDNTMGYGLFDALRLVTPEVSLYNTAGEKAMNLTAGTYDVVAKLGNWYAVSSWDNTETAVTYGKEYKPVLYAAVFDKDGSFVKSKMGATISETDSTITIEDLSVADGETVTLLIWDGKNLKPLIANRYCK